MKLYIILIGTVVLMALVTGYLAFSLEGRPPLSFDEVQETKNRFRQASMPHKIVDFHSLYYMRGQLQLIDPIYRVSKMEWETHNSSQLYSEKKRCHVSASLAPSHFFSKKEWLWEEYQCGRSLNFPEHFFEKNPFLHSSGNSYVYLAMKSGEKFFDPSWIRTHLPFFHVTELSEVKKLLGGHLNGDYGILEGFSKTSLGGLIRGEISLISNDYVLFKKSNKPLSLRYNVYQKTRLDHFLQETPYEVTAYESQDGCLHRDGNICWSYTEDYLSKFVGQSSFFIFIFSIILIVLVVWIILNKIRTDRHGNEKKRMALRILTHEFRTPVASLLLITEKLRSNFDNLKPDLQELCLRMSDDIFRLQRLTEMSGKYLHVQDNKKIVTFEKINIASVNNFVYDQIQYCIEQIHYLELEEDCSITTDAYWVGICIRNLVENALKHGNPPVIVRLIKTTNRVEVQVQDGGEVKFGSIDEMTSPFVKSRVSGGMGLGLNIVEKVIKEVGGKLTFSSSPTRFTLAIRRKL